MCGIPYHTAHPYIARLLRAGRKIAICEQITLPAEGKGIAERDVVEIVTPGTVIDEDYLDEKSNNYLVAIARLRNELSFSYVDLSTGEFAATGFPWERRADRLAKELEGLRPREIIIQESLLDTDPEIAGVFKERGEALINRYPDWSFDLKASADSLRKHFGTSNLRGFGVDDDSPLILSAGLILEYLRDTSKSLLPHIRAIRPYSDEDYLSLDDSTQRNLELVTNLHDGSKRYTLIEAVDFTRTSMGARRIKNWILRPLTEVEPIRTRLEQVEDLYRNQVSLSVLREMLGGVLDLERLCARVALDRAHAKDLIAIRNSISRAASIDEKIAMVTAVRRIDGKDKERIAEITTLLERAIDENPSILLTEGRLIKPGYNDELDEIRSIRDGSKDILDGYLAEEREKTGIGSLKIRYNRIIGYFFEVTKANLGAVPAHFIRRQSLVGAERFTTDRLIELETSLNNATDRIVELERGLFLAVRGRVKKELNLLLELSDYLAGLDCIQSFAWAATVHGYSRPRITTSTSIRIEGGRHPVVEATIPAGEFVPNNCTLDSDGVSFALITGPNMAGKSTYLRQVALIVLMAQTGCFVPAEEAEIGVVDRIFCRVGAQDNLARGESTFLIEMNETANILRSATKKSLIIMDEVGRGTGTNDGLSIAWAVSEHLLDILSAKTLFATHYHELTDIHHPKLRNFSMEVLEKRDEIVFLKRVKEGPSENSYGIHVARLAGLPEQVIRRAREILVSLVTENPARFGARRDGDRSASPSGKTIPHAEPTPQPQPEEYEQHSLFRPSELVCDEIVAMDMQNSTPLDALNRIARWKKQLENQA
jgi:DNA mismatch repair protein MutS